MSMPNMDQANLRDPKNQDHMEDHHEDSPKLMLKLMQNLDSALLLLGVRSAYQTQTLLLNVVLD